ncbi:hypothetical protein BV25DRAFT_1802639 [Artomyces pyxidatus]|uniref:Uncharacterized protein n=1 Tax=Artomyces pyxidatus TaxID=48021 RepID=A0ACB8T538_9AGAM|nr:hypothetical protein BV25DRAFT_1802639 [Artomyces pyxidatus]
MSTDPLPSSTFESLLNKLLVVVELTQKPGGATTPQAKQELLHATNEFKESLSRARALAKDLPGGELLTEEQDEVIAMLERLKQKKQYQLAEFSAQVLSTESVPRRAAPSQNTQMEVDSNASTPA